MRPPHSITNHRPKVGIRWILILIFVFTAVPVVVLTLITASEANRYTRNQAYNQVEGISQIAANQYERFIDNAHQLLTGLSAMPDIQNQDVASCDRILANIVNNFPEYNNLGIVSADGTVVCSSSPEQNGRNLSQLDWFQRAVKASDFYISDYQVRRTSQKAVMVLAQPLRVKNGQTISIITAEFNLIWLQKLALTANLPKEGAISLVDGKGKVLSRYPDNDQWVGKPFSDPLLTGALSRGKSGLYESQDRSRQRKIYSYHPLLVGSKITNTYVVVENQVGLTIDAINQSAMRIILILGGSILLVLLLSWISIYQNFVVGLNAVISTAQKLSTGDLSARTGIGSAGYWEVVTLGRTFDSMATSIQEHQAQKEKILLELQESEERFRRILENARDIIFRYDFYPERRFVYINPVCMEITGYTPEEHYQDPVGVTDRLSYPGDEAVYAQYIQQGMYRNESVTLRWIRKDGQVRWVEQRIVPIIDEQGNLYGVEGIVRDVTELRGLYEATRLQVERLTTLRKIDLSITSSFDLDVSMRVVLQETLSSLRVDAAGMMLWDQANHCLTPITVSGYPAASIELNGEPHSSPLSSVLVTREPAYIDLDRSTSPRDCELLALGYHRGLVVPLISRNQVMGLLETYCKSLKPFSPDWQEFQETLAGQAVIAMENADLFKQLELKNQELLRAYDSTIESLSSALDLRDRETEGHSRRVTDLTLRMAKQYGLPESDWVQLKRGALMHDIGKMGVPDVILLKPGPLSAEEWDIMRRHPRYAYDLLYPIEFLRPALDIPYCHHEKWDGSGYPRGLKGTEIPLAARIFAIVDVWDALHSDRPYRPAWPTDQILRYLREQSGSSFAPDIVAAFMKLMDAF